MSKGKLIVIDGGDGAGKATQVALLVKRLEAQGQTVETLDFPQYTQNTFGALIRECLDGKRGDFLAVDPRIASTLFAADRFEAKPRLERWLSEGKVVILDRYVSANMMHQGAKLHDREELESFLGWLDHMEHEVFGLPRPDLIVYLAVPYEVRERLKAQAVSEGKHSAKAADQHEASAAFQEATEARARAIVAEKNDWSAVECTDGEAMRSREEIHEAVYKVVSKVIV